MKVESIEENEDGSASVTFDFSEEEAEKLIQLGLKLVTYCGASGISTNDVFSWIESQIGNKVEVERVDG
jgi:hypothetical protein